MTDHLYTIKGIGIVITYERDGGIWFKLDMIEAVRVYVLARTLKILVRGVWHELHVENPEKEMSRVIRQVEDYERRWLEGKL